MAQKKKLTPIKIPSQDYNTFPKNDSIASQINRTAIGGLNKAYIFGRNAIGLPEDKIANKIASDADLRNQQHVNDLKGFDRQVVTDRLQRNFDKSSIKKPIALVKSGYELAKDYVTHPNEIAPAQLLTSAATNPTNYIAGNLGNGVGKIGTALYNYALSNSMDNVYQKSVNNSIKDTEKTKSLMDTIRRPMSTPTRETQVRDAMKDIRTIR
jgi:hypothetical protein